MRRFILCVVFLLAAVSSACSSMPYGDLNCDGRVDLADFVILAQNWLDVNLTANFEPVRPSEIEQAAEMLKEKMNQRTN